MDGPSFTVLNINSEPVISFNYGCATVINLDDASSSSSKKAEAGIFHYLKKQSKTNL
jgi:hypothetical protein